MRHEIQVHRSIYGIRCQVAYKRHGLSKRSQKMKRKARGTMILAKADAKIVRSYMPYAR